MEVLLEHGEYAARVGVSLVEGFRCALAQVHVLGHQHTPSSKDSGSQSTMCVAADLSPRYGPHLFACLVGRFAEFSREDLAPHRAPFCFFSSLSRERGQMPLALAARVAASLFAAASDPPSKPKNSKDTAFLPSALPVELLS
eukprot:TRINITY_DN60080_c0_g1_i1.p2 TRINITY_DN60080_c0_g1~~TRINITY_DN60080_c0_g1_i1.p2  ORF type:complete len:142 (+),score=9.43 TRINITY_DN60080_c0_g1_i1:333-758(+)